MVKKFWIDGMIKMTKEKICAYCNDPTSEPKGYHPFCKDVYEKGAREMLERIFRYVDNPATIDGDAVRILNYLEKLEKKFKR